MINTGKLIPQRKEGARLSKGTITTIGLVKKDVVKIDSLLKEKLVLSKVRYGILRRQAERERRFAREKTLESKKSRTQDYDVNLKSNKKGKGFGGFLGGIFKSILIGLGFSIFKSLPTLLKLGKMIKTIAVPFTALVTVGFALIRTITNVGSKVSAQTRGIDLNKVSKKSIDSSIATFKRVLFETVALFAGGALAGMGVSRLVRGKTLTTRQSIVELEKSRLKRARTKGSRLKPTTPEMKELFDEMDATKEIRLDKMPRKISKRAANLNRVRTFDDYAEFLDFQTEGVGSLTPRFDRAKKRLTQTIAESEGFINVPRGNVKRLSLDPVRRAVQFDVQALIDSGEIKVDSKLRRFLIDSETARFKKMIDEGVKLRKLSGPDRKTVENILDFGREIPIERQIKLDKLKLKSNLVGTGLPGSTVTSGGKTGQKIFRRADGTSTIDAYEAAQKKIFGKTFKMSGEKVAVGAGKKGLSKILFNVGGEALEQSVKQTIKASVGVVPIIGDLIGLLLDIFLFGQPVGRAAFMASGSFLGSLIGGVFGLIGGPPGAFVGSIIGGIGGDLLGGAFYDLLFKDGSGGKIGTRLGESAVKKGVKSGIGMGFFRGGYSGYGGIVHAGEFVIDADSTRALERQAPGFLSALNKAKGSQINQVLETYMSYGNEGEGTETLIPLPFEKVVTRTVAVSGGSQDDGDFVSPFMDLYRRG